MSHLVKSFEETVLEQLSALRKDNEHKFDVGQQLEEIRDRIDGFKEDMRDKNSALSRQLIELRAELRAEFISKWADLEARVRTIERFLNPAVPKAAGG